MRVKVRAARRISCQAYIDLVAIVVKKLNCTLRWTKKIIWSNSISDTAALMTIADIAT